MKRFEKLNIWSVELGAIIGFVLSIFSMVMTFVTIDIRWAILGILCSGYTMFSSKMSIKLIELEQEGMENEEDKEES